MPLPTWPCFDHDELAAAAAVLSSGKVNYWTGSEGRQFESEFAEQCDTEYGIALGNGTLALELALESLQLEAEDEIVVPPRTFIATASCAIRLGLRPVFADVSLDSQNLVPESIDAAITPKTRAVIAVHHAGWPCDMDRLMSLANEHSLVVIEDCAQAHGATYKNRPVGGIGHVGAFSFCQDKIMTTGGEGGMLVTNDESIWKRAWSIKDHGKDYDTVFNKEHPPGFRWLHESMGSNYRMTEMQAAIGRVQLKKLERWNQLRNQNAKRMIDTLSRFGSVRVPVPGDDIRHAYYRLYAFVQPEYLNSGWSRDRIMGEINALGIPCFVGSCPEIYNEKAFEKLGLKPKKPLPNAHELGKTSLAFLVHPTLTDADLDRTCDAIAQVLIRATR
jgi:dTDP-4-amino-4,6-dideoxygalactose transaminase